VNTRRARPGSPALAVGYVRVSTDRQELGPEAQRAALEAWAGAHGVTIVAWHCDAGVSGGADLADRPELGAALGALRAHGAGVLAVARRDRLARDVAVAAAIERAVSQCGARVVSADGAGNGDSPADGFLRTILDAAAAYERELIRARTRAALRAKRARGERAGEVPYGFTADATGRLAPHAGEQAVIRQVHALRAAGLSLRAVVTELARAGLVSRAGKPLALTQIARIARQAA
jgi:DNA invertase Pin-like site-specific DNA recombinase